MPQEILSVSMSVPLGDRQILVCQHQACRHRGSAAVLESFQTMALPSDVTVGPCPCQGQCHLGVTVRLIPTGIWYCQVTPADVPQICAALHQGEPYRPRLNPRIHPQGKHP